MLNIKFIDNNNNNFFVNYLINFYFLDLIGYQNPDFNFNYFKFINKFWIYTIEYFWVRIKWRGKAFRVRLYKKINKFTFNFGCSHWNKLSYSNKFIFSKRHRQNYFCFFLKKKNLTNIIKLFTYIKKYNCYTRRGLRIKRKAIVVRKGKISQAFSRLHDFH